MSHGVTLCGMKTDSSIDASNLSAASVREHVDDICSSPYFITTKRCQQFLRYVVDESIEGRGEQIKERNIDHEVFGKGNNFEPGEYSLVRVKAGEVRRRLSEYYDAAPSEGIRIELPVGSYVPRIHADQESAPVEPDSAPGAAAMHGASRRHFLWMAGGAAGLAAGASLVPLLRREPAPLDRLWRPVFATRTPLLIFIPVMHEPGGAMTEWVGIGPTESLRQAADYLDARRYPYRLRFGSELTFAQLREQPSLLLGGFEVEWTQRMTHDLRFTPYVDPQTGSRAFIDRQTKQTWAQVKRPSSPYVDVDYGILCRLFDPATGQIVFLAVGTQTFGTEGAASFLFSPELFAGVARRAPAGWESRNLQAVVRVSVIGTTTTNPQLVATHFW